MYFAFHFIFMVKVKQDSILGYLDFDLTTYTYLMVATRLKVRPDHTFS